MSCTPLLLLTASLLLADQRPAPPPVWLMPPAGPQGQALRELFAHPEQWARTRARTKVLGYADHMLNRQYQDAELAAWLPKLTEWGLELGLEVGAVKPWGKTGRKVFEVQRPLWRRFERLGAKLGAVAMDEPLCAVRKDLKETDAYAVEQTAQFVAAVRAEFPAVRVGDIEPYPYLSLADHQAWLAALTPRLTELTGRGLDFYRVDVDWMHFVVGNRGSWREVKQLENWCRERRLPFSLIYWAANWGALQGRGLADDSTWYVGVQRMAQDYALAGGAPDEVVIESWVGAPGKTVPEGEQWSFCKSALDLLERFWPAPATAR